jgi:hypothetical protein
MSEANPMCDDLFSLSSFGPACGSCCRGAL